MDWFVFFLVMGNIFINALVLNSNIKDRVAMRTFVNASKIYADAYNTMARKYNEAVAAFDLVREVSDNQAELIEAILAAQMSGTPLTQEALRALLDGSNEVKARSEAPE